MHCLQQGLVNRLNEKNCYNVIITEFEIGKYRFQSNISRCNFVFCSSDISRNYGLA